MAPATPWVLHQPVHHPYVERLASAAPTVDVDDVWDVASWGAARVDVVHLHFGFETKTVEELDEWMAAVRRRGAALVFTLHDVANPHLVDQAPYRRLLARLLVGADRIITLTPTAAGCAAVLGARQPAEVLPHPHVVPFEAMARHRSDVDERRDVYVHAGTVRPNLDVPLLAALAGAARSVAGVTLVVHVRRGGARVDAVRAAVGGGRARVVVEERPDDEALWTRLAHARAVALPYRWGTHSGLLEAAHDLGTPTLAPPVGAYRDQGAVLLRAEDVVGSLRRALEHRPAVTPSGRCRELRGIVERHRALYAEVAG